MGVWVGISIVWIVLSALVAGGAAGKGYSFMGFFLLGIIAFPIALVAVLVVSDRSTSITVGSIVKTRATIPRASATDLPRGHLSKVLAVDVTKAGDPAVKILDPSGSPMWIDRRFLAIS